MGASAAARHRVHALDPLRAHAEQAVIGNGNQLVLFRARADGAGDIDIGCIDHRRRHLQELDLVAGLDFAGIEKGLLAIDDHDAFGLQRPQHAELHQIDAERPLVDAVMHQRLFDLLGKIVLHVEARRNGALHGGDGGRDIVLDPWRGNTFCRRCGIPQERLSLGRAQRIAEELVARPLADVCGGDITDVVEVETQHATQSGVADGFLGARQAFGREAVVINALFPILGLCAESRRCVRAVVFHVCSPSSPAHRLVSSMSLSFDRNAAA